MAEAITLKFGDRTFTVRPLTLGQLRAIGVGSARIRTLPADPIDAEAAWYDTNFEILAAALGRDYPEMTPEAVRGLETDFRGLLETSSAILRLSGLIPSGEAKAGATSTGSISTDA